MAKGQSTGKPQRAAEDPLADVRAAFGGDDAEPVTATEPDPETEAEHSAPLATVQDRADAVAVMIAAWHADTVATGFLHRGGRCGCRYIATRALDAMAPIQADDDDADQD